jgi:hypothetical protein
MQHVGSIERAFGERPRQRAALMQSDAMLEADPPAQTCGLDILIGQIDPGDAASITAGQEARGTNTATDVESS